MKELFINAVIAENAGEADPAHHMNINRSTESQAGPYNAAFWQYYNVSAQTARESKIIRELENRLKAITNAHGRDSDNEKENTGNGFFRATGA